MCRKKFVRAIKEILVVVTNFRGAEFKLEVTFPPQPAGAVKAGADAAKAAIKGALKAGKGAAAASGDDEAADAAEAAADLLLGGTPTYCFAFLLFGCGNYMQVLRAGMDIKKAAPEQCIDTKGDAGELICGQDDEYFYICGKESVRSKEGGGLGCFQLAFANF